MTASLEDSSRYPCIFVDSECKYVGDESAITFSASFMGDSGLDLLGEESVRALETSPRRPATRIPRRRQTKVVNCPKPPRRRSTKSSVGTDCSALSEEYTSASRFIALRLEKEKKQQRLLQEELPLPTMPRNECLERFQEEPQPRTSLELPAMPQRQRSLSSVDIFEDNDIAGLLESLPQESSHSE